MKSCIFGLCLLTLVCLASGEMKDLTFQLIEGQMARFPSHSPFQMREIFAGNWSAAVPWLAMNEIELGEHIGTHIDAPYHFHRDGLFLHEIPLSRFEGPAVVINIEERAEADGNAEVMAADLEAWEDEHGEIPDGAWVIMASGWTKYWPNQWDYVGTNDTAVPTYRFPGFSLEAAQWLVDNRPGISGIAADTISCENGPNTGGDMVVHVLLQPLGYLCVEALRDTELIPEAGATFHVWPILIHNGTGAPVRAYATWDDGEPPNTSKASFSGGAAGLFTLMSLVALMCGH